MYVPDYHQRYQAPQPATQPDPEPDMPVLADATRRRPVERRLPPLRTVRLPYHTLTEAEAQRLIAEAHGWRA